MNNCVNRECLLASVKPLEKTSYNIPGEHPWDDVNERLPPPHQEVCHINETTMAKIERAMPAIGKKFEHLPGPECYAENAYNGRHIVLQDIRACRTVQFLLYTDKYAPAIKDGLEEDWEFTSGYYRSGLCNGLRMNIYSEAQVVPARNGVASVHAAHVIPKVGLFLKFQSLGFLF